MRKTYKYPQILNVFRESFSGTDKDYTNLPIKRAVILLSIPMVLEMIMESLFAVVDIFFVAKLGADAIAVVGLTEVVVSLLIAVALGISIGITALVARRTGEHNYNAAAVVAGQALWIGLGLSIVTSISGIVFAQDILELVGASDAIAQNHSGYTAILLGGSTTIFYIFFLNAVLRGCGDASLAMRVLWIANGCNIILDPCLIFGLGPFPELGVEGAAIATTIGRTVGITYQLYYLFTNKSRIHLKRKHFHPIPSAMLHLLNISVGGILQFLFMLTSWIFLMKIVALYGSSAIAGYTIAIRFVYFTILPAWGMSNAGATLVGQNLGAGFPDRAEQSVWKVSKYSMAVMLIVGIFCLIFKEPIIRFFTMDEMVVQYGVDCLFVLSFGYIFYALGMALTQAFNGAGDTKTPTLINFVSYWVLQIPLAYFLAVNLHWGPRGVFIAIEVADIVMPCLAYVIFRRGYWKLKVV